jgi:hypothetical protein
MCKVYNTIGSLTYIKSHLRKNGIDDFKSIKELTEFKDQYSIHCQTILDDHQIIIRQEYERLKPQMDLLVSEIEQQTEAIAANQSPEIIALRNELNRYLTSTQGNVIQFFARYYKRMSIHIRLLYSEKLFQVSAKRALKRMKREFECINDRYIFISENLDEAVRRSAHEPLRVLKRKMDTINELNSFIYGAFGEQKVVKTLEGLSDDYILINDFSVSFTPAIFNKWENDYIKSVQVDHILVGPPGVFLIETKNWSNKSLDNLNFLSPIQQVKRANYALFRLLNKEVRWNGLQLQSHHWGDRKISIKNLVVFINEKPKAEFQYVKILKTNELLKFIQQGENVYSTFEVNQIAKVLNYRNNFVLVAV